MKKSFFLLALTFICLVAKAQDKQEKLFTSERVIWCGLDYSNVKCIGSEGFTDPEDIARRFFDNWNDLMKNEAQKYNFREEYGFQGLTYDLSVVDERNQMPNADELVIDTDYSLPEGKLEEIIGTYDLAIAEDGLGLLYVMETLNKNEKEASMYVVFFDIATKEILWSKKCYGKAAGFGLRNYWARPVYEVMKDTGKEITYYRKKFMKGKR